MTISECDNQISGNQQTIVNCQGVIQDAQNKINELNQIKNKVINLEDTVKNTASRAYGEISGISDVWGLVRTVINNSFFSNVLDVLKGNEYSAAIQGLEQSADRIDEEIGKLNNQIQQSRNTIDNCQNNIAQLESSKTILAQQQEE